MPAKARPHPPRTNSPSHTHACTCKHTHSFFFSFLARRLSLFWGYGLTYFSTIMSNPTLSENRTDQKHPTPLTSVIMSWTKRSAVPSTRSITVCSCYRQKHKLKLQPIIMSNSYRQKHTWNYSQSLCGVATDRNTTEITAKSPNTVATHKNNWNSYSSHKQKHNWKYSQSLQPIQLCD